MKKFKHIYIEILNVCNLSCTFCDKTRRVPKIMSVNDFKIILNKVKNYTDFICLHLMGEPLLHPDFEEILNFAGDNNIKIKLTTNGTLLKQNLKIIKNSSALKSIQISLQAYFDNQTLTNKNEIINDIFNAAEDITSSTDKAVILRIWGNPEDRQNMIKKLESYFKIDNLKNIEKNYPIKQNLVVSISNNFDWPISLKDKNELVFSCDGFKTQLGILADGSVVPCCLDSDGKMILGNLLEDSLEKILDSSLARSFKQSSSTKKPPTKLCENCSFRSRFI